LGCDARPKARFRHFRICENSGGVTVGKIGFEVPIFMFWMPRDYMKKAAQ